MQYVDPIGESLTDTFVKDVCVVTSPAKHALMTETSSQQRHRF